MLIVDHQRDGATGIGRFRVWRHLVAYIRVQHARDVHRCCSLLNVCQSDIDLADGDDQRNIVLHQECPVADREEARGGVSHPSVLVPLSGDVRDAVSDSQAHHSAGVSRGAWTLFSAWHEYS